MFFKKDSKIVIVLHLFIFNFLIDVSSKLISFVDLNLFKKSKLFSFFIDFIASDELDSHKNMTTKSVIISALTPQIYKISYTTKSNMHSIYKTLGLLQILAGLILIASLIICFSKRKIRKENSLNSNSSKVSLLNKSYMDKLKHESNDQNEFNPYSNKDGSINEFFG